MRNYTRPAGGAVYRARELPKAKESWRKGDLPDFQSVKDTWKERDEKEKRKKKIGGFTRAAPLVCRYDSRGQADRRYQKKRTGYRKSEARKREGIESGHVIFYNAPKGGVNGEKIQRRRKMTGEKGGHPKARGINPSQAIGGEEGGISAI